MQVEWEWLSQLANTHDITSWIFQWNFATQNSLSCQLFSDHYRHQVLSARISLLTSLTVDVYNHKIRHNVIVRRRKLKFLLVNVWTFDIGLKIFFCSPFSYTGDAVVTCELCLKSTKIYFLIDWLTGCLWPWLVYSSRGCWNSASWEIVMVLGRPGVDLRPMFRVYVVYLVGQQ